MFNDEAIYLEAQTFDPERFLKDGKLDRFGSQREGIRGGKKVRIL